MPRFTLMRHVLPLVLACWMTAPAHAWRGTVDVRAANGGTADVLAGRVFVDADGDSRMDADEAGVAGVAVSNGRDVVVTDADGYYSVPVAAGDAVFITQPAGYRVPVDADFIPQFSYVHQPAGSADLRFGGVPPTGPLPAAVHFPLRVSEHGSTFRAVVAGDTQTYSHREIGYVRDTLVREVAALDDPVFLIIQGDVIGDDLSLYPRLKRVLAAAGVPVYLVPGNHDLDFDATTDARSFDTFRRVFGPAYYSFDVGDVHFVVLDSVDYPCQAEDGEPAFCAKESPTYNGRIDATQLAWLARDLAVVPDDRLIVLNMHIPPVSFVDQDKRKHQLDNANALYDVLAGRRVLSLAGHTHTLEIHQPGTRYAGWTEATGARAVPFDQIIAGAACGSWWSGDPAGDGVPAAWQRLGAPRGFLEIAFDGADYRETFHATGRPGEQMSAGLVTPAFRDWADALRTWQADEDRSRVPPRNRNDMPDSGLVTVEELRAGTSLVVNVWAGSRDTRVTARIDDLAPLVLHPTQTGTGEGKTPVLDPVALREQLSVARYAQASTSSDPRAQGFELWQGARFGPAPPQPLPAFFHTTASTHIWTVQLPGDLEPGSHTAVIRARDRYGRIHGHRLVFEVVQTRPPAAARRDD